ncbi:MAG: alpha amylase C-terminal domain-containing protein, partial [Aquaticitalea sp.]
VVHSKASMIHKMPGDEWQRFANLRVLYCYMFTHPGTKLLFQGCEFAQTSEWNFTKGLDWDLLQYEFHKGIQRLIKDLNTLYRGEPALYVKQFDWEGFEWIDHSDNKNSVYVYIRHSEDPMDDIIVVCNMTPIPLRNYSVGIPNKGKLKEIFNSDAKLYGGTGDFSNKPFSTKKEPAHFRDFSAEIVIPPLGMVAFKYTEMSKKPVSRSKEKAISKKDVTKSIQKLKKKQNKIPLLKKAPKK